MGLFVRPKVPKRGLFSCLWRLYEYRAVPLFDKKGDIIGVELKEAIKDSTGNDVKVLKDGKDRTLLDSWLYNNAEAKEFAKKEFDSGLARDGATFYLS